MVCVINSTSHVFHMLSALLRTLLRSEEFNLVKALKIPRLSGRRENGRAGSPSGGRTVGRTVQRGGQAGRRMGGRASGRAGERASGRAGERASGRASERASGRAGERTIFFILMVAVLTVSQKLYDMHHEVIP